MATLTGTVHDPGGGPVAAAQVRATSQERGQSWTTQTDARGRYAFAALPVDTYELRVEHPRFRPRLRTLPLTLGQVLDVRVQLTLAGPDQTLEVTSEAPLVETRRTQVAESVVSREIAGLPLKRPQLPRPRRAHARGQPRPGFGRPTAAADPRQIQLGLRASF